MQKKKRNKNANKAKRNLKKYYVYTKKLSKKIYCHAVTQVSCRHHNYIVTGKEAWGESRCFQVSVFYANFLNKIASVDILKTFP